MSICPAISMRDALGLHLSSSLPLSREGALYAQCSAAEQKRMVLGLAHRVCFFAPAPDIEAIKPTPLCSSHWPTDASL